jgi:hypothetical protein
MMRLRFWLLTTWLLIGLVACQANSPETPIPPTSTPVATPALLVSPEPPLIASPTASLAATPVPLSIIDPQRLAAWTFFDLHDPARHDLIVPDGDVYRLDPNWQVESIQYWYRRVGKGDPSAYSTQLITRQGETFSKGAETVDGKKIQTLLLAMSNLTPGHGLIGFVMGSWDVELIGVDGRRITLQSSNLEDPDLAPWNITCNGRTYVQFDGRLAEPLTELFDPLHDPTSYGYSVRKPDEPLWFDTNPVFQHRLPVDGLVALAGSFDYVAEAGVITGISARRMAFCLWRRLLPL